MKARRKKRNPLVFGLVAAVIYFICYQIIGVLFFSGLDFLVGGIAAVAFGLIYAAIQFALNLRR